MKVIPTYILIRILACLIFSITSLSSVYSQTNFTRKINWLNDTDFDRSTVPSDPSSLPYYSERLDWNEKAGSVPRVFFTNVQFEVVKNTEFFSKTIDLKAIPTTIEIKTRLGKERKRDVAIYRFTPFRRNPENGQIERVTSFSVSVGEALPAAVSAEKSGRVKNYAAHSVLATGKWYKIRIAQEGIQKLTFADLRKIGIQDAGNLRVYGNGGVQLPYDSGLERPDDLVENPVYVYKGADNLFNEGDYILFYAQGVATWKYDSAKKKFNHRLHLYADQTVCFLTEDLGPGKRIGNPVTLNLQPNVTVTAYNAYDYREVDSLNLIKSGRQWCWKHFAIQVTHGFNFNFPNKVPEEPVKVTAAVWARSPKASANPKFYLQHGDSRFETIELSGVHTDNYEALYASSALSHSSFTPASGTFRLNFQFIQPNPSSEGWLDYVTLNTRCNLVFGGGQLLFRDAAQTGTGKVARFQIGNASLANKVWDVTDISDVKEYALIQNEGGIGFVAEANEIREYVVFDPSSATLPVPVFSGEGLGLVPNQDLHAAECPDMVILVQDELAEYAKKLSDFHLQNDGLKSLMVSPDQIYNEFSSGMPDVTAIRDFLKMFYDRSGAGDFRLKYLLFFGDGSYDNKRTVKDFPACLPTYQSQESLYPTSSYLTDDFFGLLDTGEDIEAGLLEIGIGRLPVINENEASILIDKILQYHTPETLGDWRNLVCFIGDDEDGNTHMRDANTLADKLKGEYPVFNVDKIFLDAYQQVTLPTGDRYPEVNRAIGDRMKKGALIMNYLGHGSERGLAHEEILTISDIKNWENPRRLPLFITATCEFSRFDDPSLVSAGEWVLLNPGGGGIALYSTTRLVYSSPNFVLNRELYNFAFTRDQEGKRLTLGEIMRQTKNAVGEEMNKLSFALLGDPALTLSYPEYGITMTAVNGKPAGQFRDTLKALNPSTISGYVNNIRGEKLSDFNGVVLPTIYDKEITLTNLANDGGPVMEFGVRNSILFRGKASVKNGEFSFSFIVPKDISYKVGNGKLSFYGHNGIADAGGVNQEVLIGGSSQTGINDKEGPDLKVFMNDTTFVSGGITNENPVLLARILDASGVNTTSNGIGHDITAILDGNQKNPIILNDYYESDLDQFTSGMLKYPLSKLSEGDHTIRIKVWDVMNNSTETEITFTVRSSDEVEIAHLINYPNPFTTHTDFYFEHNQGHQALDVLLQVYTVSGKLVRSFEFLSANQTEIKPGSFRVGPVPWDGLDDFGDRIGKGTYFYRVKLRTSDGRSKEAYGKLVLLK